MNVQKCAKIIIVQFIYLGYKAVFMLGYMALVRKPKL